ASAQSVTSSLRSAAFERLARAAGQRGDWAAARKLIDTARKLPVDASERRTIDGMALALDHTGPGAAALRDYFFTRGLATSPVQQAQKIVDTEPSLGIGHYLLAFQYSSLGDWAHATPEFARALESSLPSQSFVRVSARRLAIGAYRTKDRQRLGIAVAVL